MFINIVLILFHCAKLYRRIFNVLSRGRQDPGGYGALCICLPLFYCQFIQKSIKHRHMYDADVCSVPTHQLVMVAIDIAP